MEEKMKWIDKKETGRQIQRLMDERGLSTIRVSEELGLLSAQAVYNWWWGKSIPDPDNLYGLSRILGVRTDDILVGYDREKDRGIQLHRNMKEEPGERSQALPFFKRMRCNEVILYPVRTLSEAAYEMRDRRQL